jgi:hypothetical protein
VQGKFHIRFGRQGLVENVFSPPAGEMPGSPIPNVYAAFDVEADQDDRGAESERVERVWGRWRQMSD